MVVQVSIIIIIIVILYYLLYFKHLVISKVIDYVNIEQYNFICKSLFKLKDNQNALNNSQGKLSKLFAKLYLVSHDKNLDNNNNNKTINKITDNINSCNYNILNLESNNNNLQYSLNDNKIKNYSYDKTSDEDEEDSDQANEEKSKN